MTDLGDLCYAIVDRVTLLNPWGWQQLVLHTAHSEGRRVVRSIEGSSRAGIAPATGYDWCDRVMQLRLLGRDVEALHMRAAMQAISWTGERLVLERCSTGEILVHATNNHNDDDEPVFTQAIDPGKLTIGVELLAAIDAAQQILAPRMTAFYDQLGAYQRQTYDLNEQTYRFECVRGVASFDLEVIGSYSHQANSWCWSWANRSYREVPGLTERVHELQQHGAGMGVFSRGGLTTDPVFAGWLALLTGHQLGACVHRLERPGVTTYFALRRQRDTPGVSEDIACSTNQPWPVSSLLLSLVPAALAS